MKQIDLSNKRDDEFEYTEMDDDGDTSSFVVSSNVRLDFHKFLRMLKVHDLTEILQDDDRNDKSIIVPADLLADISNAEMVIEKKAATTNIYSGIFLYGLGVGALVALLVAIVMMYFEVSIALKDMIIIGVIVLVGLMLPFAIISTEPIINNFQKKHRDYLERMTEFLSRR